jgi:hypothetical protein
MRLTKRKILQVNLNRTQKQPPIFHPFFSDTTAKLKKVISHANRRVRSVKFLGCWKWFNGVLKEAEVEVTDTNKGKIDEVIHKYIGEQSSYGRCSADWKKARKQIKESPEMKQELIAQLKTLV